MVGGSHDNTFYGGTGSDTMIAAGAKNIFNFAESLSGGSHVIDGFVSGAADKIDLIGYTNSQLTAALSNATVTGGNTTISFDGGHTTITLEGFTGLSSTDFVVK
jgi:hypothetical protein